MLNYTPQRNAGVLMSMFSRAPSWRINMWPHCHCCALDRTTALVVDERCTRVIIPEADDRHIPARRRFAGDRDV